MDPILGNPCSRKKDGGSFSMPPGSSFKDNSNLGPEEGKAGQLRSLIFVSEAMTELLVLCRRNTQRDIS
jgi:hypothetical protein